MSVKLIPRSKLEMGRCSWCLVIASSTSSLLTGRRKEGVKPYREIDAAASAGAPPLVSSSPTPPPGSAPPCRGALCSGVCGQHPPGMDSKQRGLYSPF